MQELKLQKEADQLKEIEDERKKLFKERRIREAQAKEKIDAVKQENEDGESEAKIQKPAKDPLKVRSVRKFMEDQILHEEKRHEKLKKIIV